MDYGALSHQDLIRVCGTHGEADAWREFIRRFHPLIMATIRRTARHWLNVKPEALEDLAQEAYLKLCDPKRAVLLRFTSGTVEAYLTTVTARLTIDQLKARHAQRRNEARSTQLQDEDGAPSQQEGAETRAYHRVLIRECEDLFRAVTGDGQGGKRDLCILTEYYFEGKTASEIACLPSIQLTTKGVESIIRRLTMQVRHRMVENAAKK